MFNADFIQSVTNCWRPMDAPNLIKECMTAFKNGIL